MLIRKLLVFILLLSQPCFAQLETNHWFLSQNHISVNKGGVTIGLPYGNSSFFSPQNTTASISDVNGNLLFVSDGYVILDKNYNEMRDLDNVELYGRNAKIMIQQIPESEKYYLFYSTDNQSPGNGNNSRTLKYALIDMSLNNGNGDVVTYDNIIDTVISEAFTIAAGKNASEFWLVTHRHSTDSFFVYPITSAGLGSTPVVSRAGTSGELLDYVFRDLKTSYDGKMIAGIAYRNYTANFATTFSFIEVFNFDATSGKMVSRVRTLRHFGYFNVYMSLEFSPDNRLLYEGRNSRVYNLQPCGFGDGRVTQYNLCYQDSTEFSKYVVNIANTFNFCYPNISWGNIQMGADKRIYMPYTGTTVSTIDFPNRIGSYAGYEFNSLTLPTGNSGVIGTPNFTHYLMEKAIKNNIVYDGGCFPSPTNFKITNDTLTKVQWDFGDPSSLTNIVTMPAPSHIFSAPGFYTVIATLFNSKNQIIETISELVEIKDPGVRLLHGFPMDTSFCAGNTLKIKLSVVNGLYRWYRISDDGQEDYSIVSDSITIDASGKWYVEMRQNDCNGCVMKDSINVTILRKPYVNLGPDQNVCAGDSIRLEYYDDDAEVIWNTGSITPAIWVKESGVYWLQAEYDQNGCIARDTITITKQPAINFSLPRDTSLCDGQKLLLKPGVINANYTWQDGSTETEYLVTQPGLYWVKITSSFGCSKTDSILVDYISAQQVDLGNDTVICIGNSVILDAGIANAQYKWSTGQAVKSIIVSQPGKYWVQVNNGKCTISDTINVQVSSPPDLDLGNDTTLCYATSIALSTRINAANFKWQDGSIENNYVVERSGLYWVVVEKEGCTVRDSIKVDYYAESFIDAGPDVRFCEGNSAVIQATPGLFNYQWNTGADFPSITVNQQGKYVVKAEDEHGCIVKDSMNVLPFYPNPVVKLGPDKNLCTGAELMLKAGNNFSQYEWNNGSTSNSLTVNQTGSYWVTVTDQNGCNGSDTMRILEIFPSPIRFLGNDMTICSYGKLDIMPEQSFSDYLWNNGSNTRIISVSQPGIYWLKVTDNYGCTGIDSISIKLKDCMKGMYVPNAFTTNNDGRNDILRAMIFGDIEYFTFRVYNRFGRLIFSTDDPLKGWDGTIKGMSQDVGSYMWYCQYKFRNEPAQSEKGIFNLLR